MYAPEAAVGMLEMTCDSLGLKVGGDDIASLSVEARWGSEQLHIFVSCSG